MNVTELTRGATPAAIATMMGGLPLHRLAWVLPPQALWSILRRSDYESTPDGQRLRHVLEARVQEHRGSLSRAQNDAKGIGCITAYDPVVNAALVYVGDLPLFLRAVWGAAHAEGRYGLAVPVLTPPSNPLEFVEACAEAADLARVDDGLDALGGL